MPAYMRVGGEVLIGRGLRAKRYFGPVVASSDAFFLCLVSSSLGAMLGLVGAALEALASGKREIMEGDLSKLPSEITQHPDWPIRWKKGRVIVVPREAVDSIQYSFWASSDLQTKQQVFRVNLRLLRRRRVLAFLRESGWKW